MPRLLSTLFALFSVTLTIASCTGSSDKNVPIEPEKSSTKSASDAAKNAGSQTDNDNNTQGSKADPMVKPAENGSCPSGMLLVEGEYCPNAKQECVKWIDDPAKFPYARCQEFAPQSTCEGERVHMKYCIDKYESAESNGSGLPVGDISWTEAAASCKAQGKRLCQEKEWVFACEGEEMRPYPYGNVRNPEACHFERKDDLVTNTGALADHRMPVTANPQCVSPFGVQNMVGNIDEWVVLDRPHYSAKNNGKKMMSGLKGGWWGPLRNRCRPTTVDHDEHFHELQTGYRCCADSGQ